MTLPTTLDGNALDMIETNTRAAIITRTHTHLSTATACFILIETFIVTTAGRR